MEVEVTAHVVLSFAMANHGANFANWLRDRLMKKYALYEVDAVYLDSVVARSGVTIHAEYVQGRDPDKPTKPTDQWKVKLPEAASLAKPRTTAVVQPDLRPHMISPTGAFPIGAMREDWNDLYVKAMSEASVMLFVLTAEYGQSQWCMQEFGQFSQENERRQMSADKKPLRGIALEFDKIAAIGGVPHPHKITFLPATKTDGGMNGLAWDKGDYILNDDDLNKLFEEITIV